ncbi:uncharacterized protein N7484_009261 [Penicillium longicatenatum]|uniref:uncharacterized protein n=1 Tax=Penicillium longicatenatum TaxID=1561947 RepID=UPI0025466D28|nr:uncharacterized protein N7484_009261 [Penicillium longicatenatum]KAJ5635948.1 hypothetical protein N7484_009261 [Penicillium longicatenatum]
MSSNDHPESGMPKEHESGAVTSPQESQPQIESKSSPVPENTVAEHDSSAIPSDHAQSAAPVSHPATTGGESAPEATTANEPESATAIAQPATGVPSTESEELKPGAELSSEQADAEGKEVDAGPSLDITLLLTTGSRHPFTIDGPYLRKRSVNVENYDPFAMSVYTLKELIWREWRADWETRPSSPSSIRLISFGKLLDDKSPLSESKFNHDAPTVVHMTVKPQEVVDEEDAKGAKAQYSRERDNNERSPGCRCVIL